jgi:HK97 family phage major capsid protein
MRRDDIRRLHEQRAHLHAELVEMVGKAEGEDRALSGEETAEFRRMQDEFEEIGTRAQNAEKLYLQEREVEKAINSPLELRVGENGEVPLSLGEYRKQQLGDKTWDKPEYRAAYWRYLTVGSLAELDVEEQRVLSKASGAVGAFLVPTDFYDQIIRSLRFMGAIANLATEITTTTGDTINVPANTAHGSAVWLAESGAYTPSDETFANVALNAFKAATKVIISEELLTDSAFSLDSFLATEFGERIGVLENTAYINGDGSGKPLGLLANITQTQAVAGNSTTFSSSALVTAIFTLAPQYRQNASWVVADLAARNLYLMVDGQQRPLWSVNTAVAGPDTFLGYPIYTDPDLPAPGISAKSAMFGDFKRAYMIRRVDGFSMQRQNELHSDNGQVGFRGYERVDGRVVLAAAAVALQHSAT